MHPHSFPLKVWQCPVKPGMLRLVISPLQVYQAFDSDTQGLSLSSAPEPSHWVWVNAQDVATLAWPGLSGAWEGPCEGGRAALYLVPVQGDGRQRQRGDVERAVLHEAADVAHRLSKDPRAVHKPNLKPKEGRATFD